MERIEGLIPDGAPIVRSAVIRSAEQSLAPSIGAPSVVERLVNALEALRSGIQPAAPSVSITDIAHKLLLGLPEAAALSGLSRNRLREAIRDGKLEGQKIGRKWMIKRSALKSYVRKL
jgi:excisionase family DNA binding protein